MYSNKMVDKEVSIYFIMIIESLLKWIEGDDYNQYKKYEASIHDEFVLL